MKETTARTTKSENDKSESEAGQTTGTGQDAEALLKADHRKVEELFEKYKSLTSVKDKADCAKEISKELMIHTTLEEEIFYPACREKQVESKLLDEAQVEHDGAKVMIGELVGQDAGAEYYDAKVTVLSEYIKHHVGEEEKRSEGIFALAKKAGVDMNAVGQKIQTRKQELMQGMEGANLSPPEFRSLQTLSNEHDGYKETTMARQGQRGRYGDDDDDRGYSRGRGRSSERERDEQGRFMSDDERGYSSGRGESDGRGSSYGRGGTSGGRDEYRRFTSDDDDRGYSSGRGGYGRSGASGGRDEYGRFTSDDDDRGYSSSRRSSGRYRDEEEGNKRGRYADDQGYSEGYRAGRGSGRHDESDDGYSTGRGSSYSRSGSSGGRDEYGRFWNDDNRGGYSGSGRGGSYGRGGSSGERDRDEAGRFTSDDDRGYSSSRRSSSRYRDDHDDDRSGQGQGWFGDSEGHARAARRGWRNRD